MTRSERKRFWRWLRKHNCSKQYAVNCYNRRDLTRYPAQPLMAAFVWPATPEGGKFWGKIRSRMYEDERL